MSTPAITGGSTAILLQNASSESAGINWWGASIFILFCLFAIAIVVTDYRDKKKRKSEAGKENKPGQDD